MPYHPMKEHMNKLDEWGSSQMKKYQQSSNAGPKASVGDRFKLARGIDDRWDRSSKSKQQQQEEGESREGEDPNNIVPRRVQAPPPKSSFASLSKGPAPPPPPQRTGSSSNSSNNSSNRNVPGSSRATAADTVGRGPPPSLPRRMDNENGTDNPPPSYNHVARAQPPPPPPPSRAPAPTTTVPTIVPAASAQVDGPGYLEFSKFTQADKDAFFNLLDEFFDSKLNIARSGGGPASHGGKLAGPAAQQATKVVAAGIPKPRSTPTISKEPIVDASGPSSSSSSSAASAKATSADAYPRLGTSRRPHDEICKALEQATFFCYPQSYREWDGPTPWFLTKTNQLPTPLQNRLDMSWRSQTMSLGTAHTFNFSCFFDDLSILWCHITWNATDPAATYRCEVAYRPPPPAWQDEERLKSAGEGYGEWIATFAEDAAAREQHVGNGECWTLADEAIKYTNREAKLTAENRLMQSIGRTHGHLIYACRADEKHGQSGRWRGGDRIRNNWGGLRRGDIIEYRAARLRVADQPRMTMRMGNPPSQPDHTGVVVSNTPVPERLSERQRNTARKPSSRMAPGGDEEDLYKVLGVSRRATQVEIRAAYLQGARSFHPDKASGHDARIRLLNQANATLSDATSRREYDESLRQGSAASYLASANKRRISSTLDLEAFDVVQGDEANGEDEYSFSYPCRCGSQFILTQAEVEMGAEEVAVPCSGCSERVLVQGLPAPQVPSSGGQDSSVNKEENDDDDEKDYQPTLAPWELGTITTIDQSAQSVPKRTVLDLGPNAFTAGEIWVYRPVSEKELLGGQVTCDWPPTLSGWERLA